MQIKEKLLPKAQEHCNNLIKLDDLVTIHEVDYEINIDKLNNSMIKEVAESYALWGNKVEEPLFAITNINIDASEIMGYGDNNGFIKIRHNNIGFIKKYCAKHEFDEITHRDRSTLGKNKKKLKLTVIGTFVVDEYMGKYYPQVRVKHWYSEELEENIDDLSIDDIF